MMFTKIKPEEIVRNPFLLFNKDWALLTGGTPENCNPMTVSWGGVGILWNKPVATVYVRPQRYTYGYTEACDTFTLSFFKEGEGRDALVYCGKYSGRDGDKVKACGLTVCDLDGGAGFEEAELVLVCKTKYKDDLKEDNFLDHEICNKDYPTKDFHRMYIAEIIGAYKKA